MMKVDKVVIAILFSVAALLFLIGWTFYQSLQLDSSPKIKESEYPQKAVMAQAQALNQARLNELAQSGKVVAGMTKEQVRNALGDPSRIEQMEQSDEHITVWWYEHEGWMSVVFNRDGVVGRIEKQP